MQLCEVHVRIVDTEDDLMHEVSMQLKPDNTRAYKINRRNKTGKEVKVRGALLHRYSGLSSRCQQQAQAAGIVTCMH